MSSKQYFKYAYLVPLILPFIVLFIEIMIGSFTSRDFGELTGILLMSLFFGGVPYLFFLMGFYRWIKDKSGKQIHSMSYLFPVFYMFLFLIWLVAYILVLGSGNFDDPFSLLMGDYFLWFLLYNW